MLKLFLRVLVAFLAVVGLFLLVGCLIPRQYNIEATVEISAPKEQVFPWVNRLQNWEQWSPISESRIDSLSVEYSGEEAGVNAIQTWREPRGEGKMWITKSTSHELIEYSWRFTNFPELVGSFQFQDSPGNKSVVTWRSSGKLPAGPFYGYLSLLFESAMADEYAKSLQRLKSQVESAANKKPAEKSAG